MDEGRAQELARTPPLRSSGGRPARLVRALVERLLAFLNRVLRNRHPGNFDEEYGSWFLPDVNLLVDPPRPLVNPSCRRRILVYNVGVVPTDRCTLLGQLAALQIALDEIAAYLRQDYRCTNPNCVREVGRLIWIGLDCFANPTADVGAALVEFRCEVEL